MHLIAGLGNPGRRYIYTRHNAGFWVLDYLAHQYKINWEKSRLAAAFLAKTHFVSGEPVLLLKPQTYMNLSGEAVREVVRYYRIPPQQVLAVHDDLDLPEMALRIRQKGSAGGHRGIASIIDQLHTQDFGRLKIGIGRPQQMSAADYVLQPLPKKDWLMWQDTIKEAAAAAAMIIERGYSEAMNKFNSQ